MSCALGEDRPHRPASGTDGAATILTDEARRGGLDPSAVRNVLRAADAAPHGYRERGSPREVEVLRLVARGGTNKDVAPTLGISARTVQHHVAHIYTNVGVTGFVPAQRFQAEHGLAAGSQ